MRTIELVKGMRSSALGFGCAPILGSIEAKKARRALDCALDLGINHFDLARSYGYGQAEHFVGKAINSRRDKVILASKFGIQANWKASLLRPLKPLVRLIGDRQKRDKKESKGETFKIADHFHDRIPLRSVTMRNSLEKSLQAIRTDYLDYLFIHEPQDKIHYIDELIDTAYQLKKEGKIRAWGLAYMREKEILHKDYLSEFDVLQFDNAFGSVGYDKTVKERGSKSNILFSPLSGSKSDLKSKDKLLKLYDDFPQSVVLCSMFNEQHIIENIGLVR